MVKLRNKYRIVADSYCGFEVQIKRWWLPWWWECWAPGYGVNTFPSIELAEKFIEAHKNGRLVRVVKEVA